MRIIFFARRVAKELLRDPLSYIFCLGFPIFMLLLFNVINGSMPPEAQIDLFRMKNIAPGIGMFGLTFIMLFTSLQISKDRESSLLVRLYTSPMTAADFILGYALPIFVIALVQTVICFAAASVIGLITGQTLPLVGCILSGLSLLPAMVLFIGLGVLLGSVMNDKTAPAVTSVLITASSLLGGVWMPVDQMKGLGTICGYLPFFPCVKAARAAMAQSGEILTNELIVLAYAVVVMALAVLAFKKKMRQ